MDKIPPVPEPSYYRVRTVSFGSSFDFSPGTAFSTLECGVEGCSWQEMTDSCLGNEYIFRKVRDHQRLQHPGLMHVLTSAGWVTWAALNNLPGIPYKDGWFDGK